MSKRTAYFRFGAGLAAVGLCALGARGMQAQGFQAPAAAPPPPIHQSTDPVLKNFTWRSIGPANMGGRIDDIAVVESNPSTYYVGFATGGLWKTVNNGTTWTSLFDEQPVHSIGDVTVAPSDPNVVYVGTGEPNNRQSSSFGAGVYKSIDAGKTWKYVGLKETQSIARMVIHPKDPNTVYVAAVGHLFGPNAERGLYKTTDGGATWTNTKVIDQDTGFIDVVIDPVNPNIALRRVIPAPPAAVGLQRRRSGQRHLEDDRRGEDVDPADRQRPARQPDHRPHRPRPRALEAADDLRIDRGGPERWHRRRRQRRRDARGPRPGTRRRGAARVARRPRLPDPAKSGIWRSDDAGKTWKFLSNTMDRPMYYSKIRVDPTNPEIAYQGGAPFFKTVDGGKTWRQVQGLAHSDHHAIWVNPRDNNHLLVGNDGGLDVTYDQGDTWEFLNHMGGLGQFYKVSVDMQKPYNVCGGLQDNGSWCGPSAVRSGNGILNSDWFRVGGGDGFYTASDPTDWRIVYSESQDGNTNRLDLGRGTTTSIRPRGPAGRGGQQLPPAAEGVDPAILAQFGFGPGAAERQHRAATAAGDELPLLLEHAVRAVVAQSVDDLCRRRAPVQVDGSRQHVCDVRRPDAQHRSKRSSDHGCGRQGADGVQARRRGGVQQHRDDQRIPDHSRDRLGRHQ